MGVNVSTAKLEQERSMAIDKEIEEARKRFRKEIKVLLLGTPGSGKSTIMKQMKIVCGDGYTPDERAAFRLVVYENLVDSAKDLVLTVKKIREDYGGEDINRKFAAQILEYKVGSDPSFRLTPDIANAIQCLWKDPITTTAMGSSSELYLPDSASYFFSEVQRIAQKDYIPSEKDVLKAKAKTKPKGIVETRIDLGPMPVLVLDVSGQRTERKKWIHCFEAVTSIIFCASLSDYDQVLLEDKHQNRMAESLILFESVVNSRWFLRTSIVLFLTKIDVFKSKLATVPLKPYFPEYDGGADVNKAAKYILWRYMQANRARLSIYPHCLLSWDMGANISTKRKVEQERAQRSRDIDKQIDADSRRLEHKVLLLGSGANTVTKQMRLLYRNGYSFDELAAFRPVIYKNLVDSAKGIVLIMKNIGVECAREINRTYAVQILDYEVGNDLAFRLAPDIANAIDSLWNDPIIATVMDHSFEFDLPDSANYFLSETQRISQGDYVPSYTDVLKATARTTGIMETRIGLGSLSISIFDVSDLRSERRKWIHCFDCVGSIMFCVALSDYNQIVEEGKSQNKMAESLLLFESIVNSHYFSRAYVFLLLDKIDVFKAKLARVPLERYFPEYTGGTDSNEAAKYILRKFTEANRAKLSIYPHPGATGGCFLEYANGPDINKTVKYILQSLAQNNRERLAALLAIDLMVGGEDTLLLSDS
ncbi:Guanine nucleotide-binding protein alpha-2 subunit [Tulasnella sp. UAMH 9824]|nr:Guanine nucleotide-binding protein alpha-2 subunit [Tulasnella sp. UAMH 9824]